MLFNSYYFLLVFLPIVFLGYHLLIFWKFVTLAKIWLVIGSLYFYSFFKISYLPLILGSVVVNYWISTQFAALKSKPSHRVLRKLLFVVGIIANIALLFYFKYAGFFAHSLNDLFRMNLPVLELILPLGISFYTFQQLSFLVDLYLERNEKFNFIDYCLFVTFFPQLIAGPILLSGEMLPQFTNKLNHKINYNNVNIGLFFFFCGLVKKCFIADTIAVVANTGFDTNTTLTFAEAWISALAFTLQLYFDFSGYCDMAIGIAKLFNIELPINFNSPYKATDFQDFWRRWHCTLGRFMMNYIYIPLGGNRSGSRRTMINLLIVFVVSGLWHGAGWLFLIWGILHGVGILCHRLWSRRSGSIANFKLHAVLATLITFFTVNLFWIFFRATSMERAVSMISSMFGGCGFDALSVSFINALNRGGISYKLVVMLMGFSLILIFFFPNSNQMSKAMVRFPFMRVVLTGVLGVIGILCIGRDVPFLYFNF